MKEELDRVLDLSGDFRDFLSKEEFLKCEEHAFLSAVRYLQELEKSDQALQLLDVITERDVKLSPQVDLQLRYLRADALLSTERHSEAVALYSEILQQKTSDVAYCNRALAQWELGEFEAALRDYLQAIELNAVNKQALRGAGEMLIRLDRPSEAVRHLQEAVRLDPEYAAAFRALGVAYYNSSEEWLQAHRALRRALELNPDDKVAALGIAKIENHFDLD